MSWVCKSHRQTSHDGFISYRVAADDGVAELLQARLQERNLSIFLDKQCLKHGEDWQIGFLNGLENSRFLFYLLSEKSLGIMVEKLKKEVSFSDLLFLWLHTNKYSRSRIMFSSRLREVWSFKVLERQ
jgi:TIR domain